MNHENRNTATDANKNHTQSERKHALESKHEGAKEQRMLGDGKRLPQTPPLSSEGPKERPCMHMFFRLIGENSGR